ncbi:MAG: hypothetical protein GU359_04215 [Desulfurococcales archaeon]|nr:hypothetical protein [Desulfurococcales archaeon]
MGIVLSIETEIMSFEVEGECDWMTAELEDGTVLAIKPYIGQIARVGYDPNTGVPIYAVGTGFQLRYISVQKRNHVFPELVKAKISGECPWINVKIDDGSILKVKPNIVSIVRIGVDPAGVPQYMIQIQAAIQVQKIPKELIKKPAHKTMMHT